MPRPPAGKEAGERLSRLTMRIESGGEPDLPEIAPELQPFVAMLFEAGPTSIAGQGAVPLTWADLAAWQAGTGIDLPPWQLRLLRRLSSEYLTESHAAEAHDAPPPWQRENVPKWKQQQAAMRKLTEL